VDTVGLEEAARTSPGLASRLQRQLKRYMVPRFGQPADVAGLVTFLASPLAAWINGGYSVTQ
jgi:NAD(P)-dependent dehydrogenase (short-subunit alcohol dehydrogenase family)